MSATTNYGLNIYTDAEVENLGTVRDWRSKVDGTGTDSNMVKIDAALKDIADSIPAASDFKGRVWTNTTVEVSDWVSDNTYEDYPYKAVISKTGITANDILFVVFDMTEAVSGNYAPICSSAAGTVTIYAKEVPAADIIIPVIKEVV